MNYRSISDMSEVLRKGLARIPKDIELIVGIPRSGMLPASMLALYLNLPLTDTMSLLSEQKHNTVSRNLRISGASGSTDIHDYKKIMVIDDSCHTGQSLNEIRQRIASIPDCDTEVIYACVFATPESTSYVDLYFDIVPQLRVFEWNIMNHPLICNLSCFDIDGVLCVDPTDEQNDDGEKYINFILNAQPLWTPKFRIGALVTSRLEKYRPYTEKWLSDHNIQYQNLIMLNLPNKEARMRLNAHAPFKAEIYSKVQDSVLFIESDPSQAEYIAMATGKAVYCVSSNQFYNEENPVDVFLSKKETYDSFISQASGIIEKLISLYDHIDNMDLIPSITTALISGLDSIINEMHNKFPSSAYNELEKLSKEAHSYRDLGDYDNCLSTLIDMPIRCYEIISKETNRQIIAAFETIKDKEWKKNHMYLINK